MNEFEDKVVVITGGATGIGFSFARRFGKEGAKLVIAGRRQELLTRPARYPDPNNTQGTMIGRNRTERTMGPLC